MARKMTAKQKKYFGTKRQRAALSKRRVSKTRVVNVVKRRSYSRVKRYGRRVARGFAPSKALIGGAVYSLAEPMIETLPMMNSPYIRAGAGYLLAKKSGVVGDIGKAALYIEIYKLAKGFSLGSLGGQSAGASQYM